MFNKSIKVQFRDQQLDDYVLENSVLKSKLQSKVDALTIMSKELDKCSMERDRYRLLVEQLKSKNVVMSDNTNNQYSFTLTHTISSSELLAKTREQNNMLKLEIETLTNKLEEAGGDIVALRKHLKHGTNWEENSQVRTIPSQTVNKCKEFEQLVQDLEKNQNKYRQIQLDYRATLDEKEELVSDRDYYKNKVHRLNHQLSFILAKRHKSEADTNEDLSKPIVDIDALLAENKYLHERITQLQVEKEIIKRTLTKYKNLVDNRGKNNHFDLKKGFADAMTQKQVREYLDINSKTGFKRSSAMELKAICLGLFEALNDKSIALQHQRKTNQILANRINDLEKTLESWCNGQKCIPIFPSHMLIEEVLYDTNSIKSDETKEKIEKEENSSDNQNRSVTVFEDGSDEPGRENGGSNHAIISTKIILPQELEELVREALAELKSAH